MTHALSPNGQFQLPDLEVESYRAIQMLVEAYDAVQERGVTCDDMAVELVELAPSRISSHELRLMVLAGFLRQGMGQTSDGQEHRQFFWVDRPLLAFLPRCGVMLTDPGAKWARSWLSRIAPLRARENGNGTTHFGLIPEWHEDTSELWLLGQPILQFKHPISHVKSLVEEFHRHYWASTIDNPFLRESQIKGIDILRAAVEKLNRALRGQLLHIRIFNSGKKTGWKIQLPTRGKAAANGL